MNILSSFNMSQYKFIAIKFQIFIREAHSHVSDKVCCQRILFAQRFFVIEKLKILMT